jgi:hypothetical protein
MQQWQLRGKLHVDHHANPLVPNCCPHMTSFGFVTRLAVRTSLVSNRMISLAVRRWLIQNAYPFRSALGRGSPT